MKRSVVAFISIFFFIAVAISTFGCAPDAGKIYSEKKSKMENEKLNERIVQLEKEVASLEEELRSCLEKRIESLGKEKE